MRAPSPLINDLSRPDGQPRPGIWVTLGYIGYCIAFWIGVGFGIRALTNVL